MHLPATHFNLASRKVKQAFRNLQAPLSLPLMRPDTFVPNAVIRNDMKGIYLLTAILGIILAIPSQQLSAQTTIAFQGGEGTGADNWGFVAITNAGGPIAPGIVPTLPRTGSFAIRAGGGNTAGCGGGANCIAGGGATTCPMHGNTIQFNPVNVSCLSGVQLSVYHRSHTICSGTGFDASDNLNFEVRLNGGAWTTIQTMATTGDYSWTYATNPAGIPATVPNPWVYNVPPGTNSFEFRVRATVNRSDEVFYLDDVRLTTTTSGYTLPGAAGLWNGIQDENWFNACNWDDRVVPTAATDVIFPASTANNDIVIQAGQNCQCNNLTFTGTGAKFKGENGPTKVLTCFGNININTSPTSDVFDFSDGSNGTPDGTINLYGNWNNNSDETDFKQGESTVNLLGTGNQTIALATGQPYEVFYNLVVNKPSGDVIISKNAEIEGVLTLTNGKVTTNANHIYTSSTATGAVAGHSIASYVNGNLRRQIQTGAGTRTYAFPLGTAADYELASLSLTNPSGVNFIDGFFNSTIGGTAPSITEAGYVYNTMLNAGVWTLAPSPSFTGTYSVSLSERGYTNGAAATYIDVKRPNVGGTWTNPGTHVSWSEVGGTVNCQRSGLTTFSDFGIALSNTPFAINTLNFDALPQADGTVLLQWAWAEPLNGRFELERVSGDDLIPVGQWPIESVFQQSTMDQQVPNGLVQYQLYHVDGNGERSLVATQEVLNAGEGSLMPKIWPNPSNGSAHLQLLDDGQWMLEMVKADGASVLNVTADAASVSSQFEVLSAGLKSGIYFLQLRNAGKSYNLRFVRR
jgi:hypothetical protein